MIILCCTVLNFIRSEALLVKYVPIIRKNLNKFIIAQLSFIKVISIYIIFRSPPITIQVYPFGFSDNDEKNKDKNKELPGSPTAEPIDKIAKVLQFGYSDISQQYITFLTTLKRPRGMEGKEYRKFKSEAFKYIIQDGYLFRQASKNIPIRRIINNSDNRSSILYALYKDCGHRGKEGIYKRMADRYWWKDLVKDIR